MVFLIRVEEALQHNETVDILKEDFMLPEIPACPEEQATAGEELREAITFSDISHSKNKLISSIHWIPECAGQSRSCS